MSKEQPKASPKASPKKSPQELPKALDPNFRPHTFASLCKKPIHFFAFGFGSGLLHPAPGTWGTLAGAILFYPLAQIFSGFLMPIFLIVTFLFGCWVCDRSAKEIGVHDFSEIVWDEFVGIWLVLACFPTVITAKVGIFATYFLAFVLFRFFDIVKPQPIGWLDRHAPGGFGIMIDDVLAAFFALAVLWAGTLVI